MKNTMREQLWFTSKDLDTIKINSADLIHSAIEMGERCTGGIINGSQHDEHDEEDKNDECYCIRGLEQYIRLQENDDTPVLQEDKNQRLVRSLMKEQKKQHRKKTFDELELSRICQAATRRDSVEAFERGKIDEKYIKRISIISQ